MSFGHLFRNVCFDGVTNHRTGTVLPATLQIVSDWVTHTWLHSLWEKVDKFNITVEIAPLPMDLPQTGDKWFMQAGEEASFTSEKEKEIINCFRCYQEVVHLSDVLDAGGQCIDKKYLGQQQPGQKWPTLIFPVENPPQGHLRIWQE
jgi:hypothetical protein